MHIVTDPLLKNPSSPYGSVALIALYNLLVEDFWNRSMGWKELMEERWQFSAIKIYGGGCETLVRF